MSTQATSSVPGGSQVFDAIVPGFSAKVEVTDVNQTFGPAPSNASIIQVCSDAPCFITFGSSSVVAAADGSCPYLPANVPVKFGITGGTYIAAITASSTANLYLTIGA